MNRHYQEKPTPHFTPGDWHSYNKNLDTVTRKVTITGNNVRQEAAQCRNSVNNIMAWKLRDTNNKLADRINEVEQWFRNLDRSLKEVQDAVDRLAEAKQEVEKTIPENLPLLETANEALSLRDRRRDIDLVEDEVYYELRKEKDLIQNINSSLSEVAKHDWDHLIELKKQRDQLVADLNDKELAMKIDRFQLSLTPTSTNIISFKPWPADACSAGQCPISLETWLQNCLDKRRKAEDAIAKATRATNDSWNLIRKSKEDIRQQRENTQFALRKRRHETLQARDKLAAQRKDLKDEIDRLDKEMLTIEQDISTSKGNLKLVETRLEYRKSRLGMELVRDHPTFGLEGELRHVVESREYLAQRLRDVKNMLNRVQHHLHEVEDDLERKERSLAIEMTTLDLHERPSKSPYQMDIAWMAPRNTTSSSFLSDLVRRGTNQRLIDHSYEDNTSCHCNTKLEQAVMTEPTDVEYRLVD